MQDLAAIGSRRSGTPETGCPELSYIICTTPRTGSYLLCEALGRTGISGTPNEYLSGGFQQYWMPRWGLSDYPQFLGRIRRIGMTPNGVFGVKVHSIQLRHFLRQATGRDDAAVHEWRAALERWFPGARYVWLRREDRMRQAISYARALQTRIWWDAEKPPAPYDAPRPEAARFDPDWIDRALAWLTEGEESWRRYFDVHGIAPLELTYETMVPDLESTTRRVVEFLGLELDPSFALAPTQFRRQSDAVTEEWLERYQAARRARRSVPASRAASPSIGAQNGGGPRPETRRSELADALQARRWWVCQRPFRHIVARQVFAPGLYEQMAAEFQSRLAENQFARSLPGYDASALSVTASAPGAFAVFASPAWRALWASLLAPDSTREVNITLHHHDVGSRNGQPHNDLNPGWFIDDDSRPVNLADPRVCSYTTGKTRDGQPAIERVRSVALIFYLANPGHFAGPGGETGLYERASDPVHQPVVAVPPVNNSLVAFECTPYSFHSFISNHLAERNCLVMWLHRPKEEVVRRWGSRSIVPW